MLNTSNPNNYEYTTKHLEIHILGGIKLNKLESLRVTISIQKAMRCCMGLNTLIFFLPLESIINKTALIHLPLVYNGRIG